MERVKKRGKGLDPMINAQDKSVCARVSRKREMQMRFEQKERVVESIRESNERGSEPTVSRIINNNKARCQQGYSRRRPCVAGMPAQKRNSQRKMTEDNKRMKVRIKATSINRGQI